MKAIYLTKYGDADKAFETRQVEKPRAQEDELIIQVMSFGLNFADVVARRGMYPEAPKNPCVLGYDVGGYVHEVGSGVEGFVKGDKVVALTRFGGYSEFAVARKEAVALIPSGYSFDLSVALATQACTAYFCAIESVSLHPGDIVLIQAAAGGVGSMLVQLCKHKGCYVIGTSSGSKHYFLEKLGVDLCIDYTKDDFAKVIVEKLGPKKLDVVFDSIGGKTFSKAMKQLAPGGKMVNFGAAAQIHGSKTNMLRSLGVVLGFGLFSPLSFLMNSKSLIAVNMLKIADHRPHVFNHVLKAVVRLAEEKIIVSTVGKAFPAEDIVDAHYYLENRNSIGKVVVRW